MGTTNQVRDATAIPPKVGMAMGIMMSDPRPELVSTGSSARIVVALVMTAARMREGTDAEGDGGLNERVSVCDGRGASGSLEHHMSVKDEAHANRMVRFMADVLVRSGPIEKHRGTVRAARTVPQGRVSIVARRPGVPVSDCARTPRGSSPSGRSRSDAWGVQ